MSPCAPRRLLSADPVLSGTCATGGHVPRVRATGEIFGRMGTTTAARPCRNRVCCGLRRSTAGGFAEEPKQAVPFVDGPRGMGIALADHTPVATDPPSRCHICAPACGPRPPCLAKDGRFVYSLTRVTRQYVARGLAGAGSEAATGTAGL